MTMAGFLQKDPLMDPGCCSALFILSGFGLPGYSLSAGTGPFPEIVRVPPAPVSFHELHHEEHFK
jgi:hypothetical protein